jgi:hypothetical protein
MPRVHKPLTEERKQKKRDQWAKDRLTALERYSGSPPKCKCCGETELVFLCLDHTKGDGNTHRREIGGAARIFEWLRKNDYPSGFQVLCHNCNFAEHRGGCPHKHGK